MSILSRQKRDGNKNGESKKRNLSRVLVEYTELALFKQIEINDN